MSLRPILAAFLVGLALLPAASAREMPGEPTPVRSSAPGYAEFAVDSSDYEVVERARWGYETEDGQTTFHLHGRVELLSDVRADYEQGIYLGAWLDLDGDRNFEDAERLLWTSRFPARGQRHLSFHGKLLLPGDAPAAAYLRLVVSYGVAAGPVGQVEYGDVKDFVARSGEDGAMIQPGVIVRGPSDPPAAAPGQSVETVITVEETVPGALQGNFVFVSPKGTAVALVNGEDGVQVKSGNIRIGKSRTKKDTTRIHIRDRSTVASTLEIRFSVAIDAGFTGPVDVSTNVSDELVRVLRDPAAAPPPPPGPGPIIIDPTQTPAPVVTPGASDQPVSPITITEQSAGSLQPGVIEFVSPKGTAVALKNGASIRVKSGNVKLGKVKVKGRKIEVEVLEASTEPSAIELTTNIDVSPTYTEPTVELTNNIVGAVDSSFSATSSTAVATTSP